MTFESPRWIAGILLAVSGSLIGGIASAQPSIEPCILSGTVTSAGTPLPGVAIVITRDGINNKIRGSIGDSLASSSLDAAPFSLNGSPTEKVDYFRQHLTGTVGGPLSVPGLLAPQQRTFFFLNG